MATKIVKTLKFPNSSDDFQINAVKLEGKRASDFVDSLSDLGITATATELNYVDGVTSNVQTQLNTLGDTCDEVFATCVNLSSSLSTNVNNLQKQIQGKADLIHNHIASEITSGTIAAARLPAASGTSAGITIVYPADSCTTFSSDSGTVTPKAVQKGAKMFAITRPSTSTTNAVTRYSNTTGDVKDSKITIEDVTNTKDSSKKANVLVIPAEGNKKMVYGYCTDQVDGTSFIGGVFDASATSYPYASGLAIGGTSGNLLWKGKQVATTDMIPTSLKSPKAITFTGGVTGTYDGSAAKTVAIPTTLKNPYALTFTGAVTGTYDGSAAKSIAIPTAESVADEVVTLLKTSGDVVVGSVDENKNILLDGALADAMYTLKYKNADGTTTTIGTLKAGKGYRDVAELGEWILNKRINSSFQMVDAPGHAIFKVPATGLLTTTPSVARVKFSTSINLRTSDMKEVYWRSANSIPSYQFNYYKGAGGNAYLTQDSNGIWKYDIGYITDYNANTNYRLANPYSEFTHFGLSLKLSDSSITNANLPTINMSVNEELLV